MRPPGPACANTQPASTGAGEGSIRARISRTALAVLAVPVVALAGRPHMACLVRPERPLIGALWPTNRDGLVSMGAGPDASLADAWGIAGGRLMETMDDRKQQGRRNDPARAALGQCSPHGWRSSRGRVLRALAIIFEFLCRCRQAPDVAASGAGNARRYEPPRSGRAMPNGAELGQRIGGGESWTRLSRIAPLDQRTASRTNYSADLTAHFWQRMEACSTETMRTKVGRLAIDLKTGLNVASRTILRCGAPVHRSELSNQRNLHMQP